MESLAALMKFILSTDTKICLVHEAYLYRQLIWMDGYNLAKHAHGVSTQHIALNLDNSD